MKNENLVLIAQFCMHHNVELSFISSLHQFGLINILELEDEHYLSIDEIIEVEKMARLHYELGINLEGVDAVANLLKQIATLQQELMMARNRLDTFAPLF
ncbi:MAG: chaperone modulator CbpM [Pedobacter sp.]|nr:chaperone modulator CbpM [Pedobacter sp.]